MLILGHFRPFGMVDGNFNTCEVQGQLDLLQGGSGRAAEQYSKCDRMDLPHHNITHTKALMLQWLFVSRLCPDAAGNPGTYSLPNIRSPKFR
jgi:hypothetical protein